jgi:hypothetical protein
MDTPASDTLIIDHHLSNEAIDLKIDEALRAAVNILRAGGDDTSIPAGSDAEVGLYLGRLRQFRTIKHLVVRSGPYEYVAGMLAWARDYLLDSEVADPPLTLFPLVESLTICPELFQETGVTYNPELWEVLTHDLPCLEHLKLDFGAGETEGRDQAGVVQLLNIEKWRWKKLRSITTLNVLPTTPICALHGGTTRIVYAPHLKIDESALHFTKRRQWRIMRAIQETIDVPKSPLPPVLAKGEAGGEDVGAPPALGAEVREAPAAKRQKRVEENRVEREQSVLPASLDDIHVPDKEEPVDQVDIAVGGAEDELPLTMDDIHVALKPEPEPELDIAGYSAGDEGASAVGAQSGDTQSGAASTATAGSGSGTEQTRAKLVWEAKGIVNIVDWDRGLSPAQAENFMKDIKRRVLEHYGHRWVQVSGDPPQKPFKKVKTIGRANAVFRRLGFWKCKEWTGESADLCVVRFGSARKHADCLG